MPVYEYEHLGADVPDAVPCVLGRQFECTQSIREPALEACPRCGRPVKRLISRTFISTPQSNSDLKALGFTKLVKRDTGVYENVTASDNEKRYMIAGQPDTVPSFKGKIED